MLIICGGLISLGVRFIATEWKEKTEMSVFLVVRSCTSVIGTRVSMHASCGCASALSLKSTWQTVVVLTCFVRSFMCVQHGAPSQECLICASGTSYVLGKNWCARHREIITRCNGPKEGCSVRSRKSGTDRQHCPTPEEVARHELPHLRAAAWCKVSVSVWGAYEQWREIFGREKSDLDVPPVKELYRPLQPEPHFKSTRTQLVSEVEDLNKQVTSPSRDKERWEKMTKQKTTDLAERSCSCRVDKPGPEISVRSCPR